MNKAILGTLFLFGLLLLSGCINPDNQDTITQNNSEEVIVETTNTSTLQNNSSEGEEPDWFSKAIEEQNYQYCLKLEGTDQEECFEELSPYSIPACLEVKDQDIKRNCIWQIVNKTKNISYCDYLQYPESAECINQLTDKCEELEGEEKNTCLAIERNSISYCETDECRFKYAVEKENQVACEEIEKEPIELACNIELGSNESCDDLNRSDADLCYYYRAMAENRTDLCQNTEAKIQYNCYLYFAEERDNPRICSNLNLLYRWECMTQYALDTGNLSGCEEIDELADNSRDNCFNQYANKYQRPSVCNGIANLRYKKNCYAGLINKDIGLSYEECSNIVYGAWRDNCFTHLAKLKNNKIYCKYITGGAEELCYSQFE